MRSDLHRQEKSKKKKKKKELVNNTLILKINGRKDGLMDGK